MSTPPEDAFLPARLRAQAVIREGEQRIMRRWWSSLTRWLDSMRPDVVTQDGIRPENVGQHSAFWGQLVERDVLPEVASVFGRVRNRVLQRREPITDQDAAAYLNESGNRLVRLPDEVYALVVRELERGHGLGESIPDLATRVRRVLTVSGSDYWPGRAVTVARTETIGAVNAGAYFGAVRDASERGDPAPFKAWLSTADPRTRPTHVEADGQRTLLTSPFIVGGAQLLFPGDPRGPAQETIMCRCTLLPFVLGEELDWTDRQDP